MRPWSHVPRSLCLVLVAALALAGGPADGQTPRRGGVLSPCYSNLVLFDPFKPQESAETVIPELAERWS